MLLFTGGVSKLTGNAVGADNTGGHTMETAPFQLRPAAARHSGSGDKRANTSILKPSEAKLLFLLHPLLCYHLA